MTHFQSSKHRFPFRHVHSYILQSCKLNEICLNSNLITVKIFGFFLIEIIEKKPNDLVLLKSPLLPERYRQKSRKKSLFSHYTTTTTIRSLFRDQFSHHIAVIFKASNLYQLLPNWRYNRQPNRPTKKSHFVRKL
jgi:hypothetical protein